MATRVVKKFYTDGRVEEGEWKMELREMQEFVGGYIEQVPTTIPNRLLIVNEEGLLDNLPNNVSASAIVNPRTHVVGGLIRGNALLVKA